MIRHIIFDMGNVLLRFDRELFLDRIGAEGTARALLCREIFESDDWLGMDRGDHDEPEAAEKMCARLPEALHPWARELVLHWDEPIVPIAGMAELAAELKAAGYGLWLLSNASRRQHEYWPRCPGNELFDGTLISADHRVIKPRREIYELCLARFGLKAEECFFLDDSPANIEGANRCGIAGFVFRGDAAEAREALRAAGVSI